MTKFSEWVLNKIFDNVDLNEAFDKESISKHQPLDGKWYPPLNNDAEAHTYKFNVPGDSGTANNPVYEARMTRSRYDTESPTYFSFYRGGSVHDTGKGVQGDVIRSVLKAYREYIDVKNPPEIKWQPVGKTNRNVKTNTIVNPEARKSIYESWAVRNLFPKYIGIQPDLWVRKDVYDEKYVKGAGLPPLPEVKEDDHVSKKKKISDELISTIAKNKEEYERIKREREAEVFRVRIQEALLNPEQNPNRVALNDIVDLSLADRWSARYEVGKIIRFVLSGDTLEADVDAPRILGSYDFSDTSTFRVTVKNIKKETEETRAERIKKAEEKKRLEEEEQKRIKEEKRLEIERLAATITVNPQQLKVGDDVVYFVKENPIDPRNGYSGKITDFRMVSYYNEMLKASIDWDQATQHKEEITSNSYPYDTNLKYLYKDTAEIRHTIENARRNAEHERRQREINDRVDAQRDRHERRVVRATNLQQTPEDIINDTVRNPNGLRAGDHVITTGGMWRFRNRQAVITSLVRTHWNIQATIKFIGSTVEKEYDATQLTKDTSEQAQQRQQRMQTRAARVTQTQTAIQSNPQNLQVGDSVRALSGRNRGRVGKILRFQNVNNAIRVTIVDEAGSQYTSQMDNLVKVVS